MAADPEKAVNLNDSNDMEEDELGEEEEVDTGFVKREQGSASEEPEELAPEVKRRVRALKKMQLDISKVEARFYAEMHVLECKYLPEYVELFEKRRAITAGEYEPNDTECDFDFGDADDLAEPISKLKVGEDGEKDGKEPVSGIPDFWLKIFHNVEMLSEMMEPQDEPILQHLTDIKVELTKEPMGFKLYFHFAPNEYFTNDVLTKSYEMKCELDMEDPFAFEGPEIVKCSGCTIDWNKGKNVTVKTIRKKQKHKQRGSVRTITKTVEASSFFNFFNPPQIPDERDAEMDEEAQIRLTNDFEVGQYIRERIVPRAVLYYTGEALEDEYEEEEEEDEEASEEEEEQEPAGRGNPRSQNRFKKGAAGQAQQQNPQDCKQQ